MIKIIDIETGEFKELKTDKIYELENDDTIILLEGLELMLSVLKNKDNISAAERIANYKIEEARLWLNKEKNIKKELD